MKEIYTGKEMRDLLLSGINKLADTVTLTMGPNGKIVGITNFNGEGYVTKDGVSVSNDIVFKNYIEDYGAKLIKQVAQKTVEQAGDGTTTSICLAQAFINKGFELIDQGISYNEIKKALDILELETLHRLKKQSKRLTKKDIINVATISANNDKQIGSLIDKAYKHSKIVKVEESDNEEDTLETIDGMQLDTSYFNKAFINNEKKKAIVYGKSKFILVDGKLENIKSILDHLKGAQELPIIIIADHFSESVVSLLKENHNQGYLKIGLIKSPGFAGHRRNLMSDLKKYFKLSIVVSNEIRIGEIDSIYADHNKVIISKDDPDRSDIENLKSLYKEESDKSTKRLIQERIDMLEGKLSIIRVGGNSELEMKERKDRIDDAVLAVKSAMEEGIVEGGGVTLAKLYIYSMYTRTPILEFSQCLMNPYDKIFGEKINPTQKDMFKKNIIDPHKVTRCAFQNAISVAKTILNMEAIVVNDRIWN